MLEQKVEHLNEKIDFKDNQLEEIKEDRDEWKIQAKKLLIQHNPKEAEPTAIETKANILAWFIPVAIIGVLALSVIAINGL